jgi:hypothetical protein
LAIPKMLKSNSSSSSSKWQFTALRIENHVQQHPIPFPLGLIMWHTSEIMAAITRKPSDRLNNNPAKHVNFKIPEETCTEIHPIQTDTEEGLPNKLIARRRRRNPGYGYGNLSRNPQQRLYQRT